jgi:hypothetical protein
MEKLLEDLNWLTGLSTHVKSHCSKYASQKHYADSVGIPDYCMSRIINQKWDKVSRPLRYKIAKTAGYDSENVKKMVDVNEGNFDDFPRFDNDEKTTIPPVEKKPEEKVERAIEIPDQEPEKAVVITKRAYVRKCNKVKKLSTPKPVTEKPLVVKKNTSEISPDIHAVNNFLLCREVIDLLPKEKRPKLISVLITDLITDLVEELQKAI